MTRVGVLGAAGRMGATVARAIEEADDLELVCAVDPVRAGTPLDEIAGTSGGLVIAGSTESLTDAGAEVAVDFTVAASARQNLAWCAAHRVHAVCGTTGLSEEDLAALATAFVSGTNCVVAPNFAISAVLLMRFAEMAAPYFDSAEVIELHHDQKRDAPSGTALETARRIAAARAAAGPFAPDPTEDLILDGARGGAGPMGVRVHAVRLRGLVAHEEVLFGATGQSLTLRQDSYDRESFMPGVLLATRRVATTPGLTVGLDALL